VGQSVPGFEFHFVLAQTQPIKRSEELDFGNGYTISKANNDVKLCNKVTIRDELNKLCKSNGKLQGTNRCLFLGSATFVSTT